MNRETCGEILVNKIFAGSYLSEGNNIGHEVINLFRADNGQNYLYITPGGTVKGHPVESVIFVRGVKGKTTVEVVAKAEKLSSIAPAEAAELRYSGVPLGKIFSENVYNGAKEGAIATNVAFQAELVRMPRRRIILTLERQFYAPEAEVIHLDSRYQAIDNQSSRKYYSLKSDPEAYRALERMLADSKLWEIKNTTQPLKIDLSPQSAASDPSFLEIIRKENDELVFSNLFKHYFCYSLPGFQKFAQEVLEIPHFGNELKVIRERDNIDLWIEGENHAIVIENKIKSGINGWKDSGENQLDDYYQKALGRTKDPKDSAYGKSIHCFIFTPNYNLIKPSNQHYTLIEYSRLHRFFEKNSDFYCQERYFSDFLSGLEKHTKSLSELNFSIMRSRFESQIRQSLLTK